MVRALHPAMPPAIQFTNLNLKPRSARRKLPWEGRRKALLIGISYREGHVNYPTLSGPPNDIEKMKNLLIGTYGFKKHEIVMMTDNDEDMSNTDLWPTHDNIVKQIEAFVHDAQPGDFLVFHFSGHSTQRIAENDPNEEDGKDEILISCDFQELVDDDIHIKLVDPLPRGSRLIAILDACHSGTLLDLPHNKCHLPLRKSSAPELALYKAKKGSLDEFIERWKFRSEASQPAVHLRWLPTRTWRDVKSRFASAKYKMMAVVGFMTKRGPPCSKKCQFTPYDGAIVVSLSACLDRQLTWEDRLQEQDTMTGVLVDILRKDPAITLGSVMQKLRENLRCTTCKRHVECRKKVEKYKKRKSDETLQKYREHPLYNYDPQDPQLGGMRKLSSTEILMPMSAPRRRFTAPTVINKFPSFNFAWM